MAIKHAEYRRVAALPVRFLKEKPRRSTPRMFFHYCCVVSRRSFRPFAGTVENFLSLNSGNPNLNWDRDNHL